MKLLTLIQEQHIKTKSNKEQHLLTCESSLNSCKTKFNEDRCQSENKFDLKRLNFTLSENQDNMKESELLLADIKKVIKQNKIDCEETKALYESNSKKFKNDIKIIDHLDNQISKKIEQLNVERKNEDSKKQKDVFEKRQKQIADQIKVLKDEQKKLEISRVQQRKVAQNITSANNTKLSNKSSKPSNTSSYDDGKKKKESKIEKEAHKEEHETRKNVTEHIPQKGAFGNKSHHDAKENNTVKSIVTDIHSKSQNITNTKNKINTTNITTISLSVKNHSNMNNTLKSRSNNTKHINKNNTSNSSKEKEEHDKKEDKKKDVKNAQNQTKHVQNKNNTKSNNLTTVHTQTGSMMTFFLNMGTLLNGVSFVQLETQIETDLGRTALAQISNKLANITSLSDRIHYLQTSLKEIRVIADILKTAKIELHSAFTSSETSCKNRLADLESKKESIEESYLHNKIGVETVGSKIMC